MGDAFNLPFVGAISAFGWACARVLMEGFAGAAGGWLFPTIACAAGFWALVAQLTQGDAYSLFKHIAAIAAAAVLLYAPVRVDLSTVVNGRIGGFGYIDPNQGAAPLPTQVVDWIGTAAATAVKRMMVGADQQILPMLDDALKDAVADRANFQDGQIAMNVATWRMLVSSALVADSSAANSIEAQGLQERLLNPTTTDVAYAGTQASRDAQAVVSVLQTLSPKLPDMLCRNTASVADLANMFMAVPWTITGDCASPDTGSVSVVILSAVTRVAMAKAQQTVQTRDPAMQPLGSHGAALLNTLFSAQAAAVETGSFSDWASLYRSLGAATLVGAAAQLGSDQQFKTLLGISCATHGDDYCGGVFAASAQAMESYIANRDERPGAPWYERIWQWFSGKEPGSGPVAVAAAAVGSLVSVLTKVVAQMVASLTPYALGAARAVAVLLSVLGIYVLLIPGRARDAFGLMVGPMAWVHVWTILFIVWYPLEMIGTEAASHLPLEGSATGFVAARAVTRFIFAMGYASLPYISWKIVFGGLSRTVPRFPLDRLVAPARNYIVRHAKRMLPKEFPTHRQGGNRNPAYVQGSQTGKQRGGDVAARRQRIPSNSPGGSPRLRP